MTPGPSPRCLWGTRPLVPYPKPIACEPSSKGFLQLELGNFRVFTAGFICLPHPIRHHPGNSFGVAAITATPPTDAPADRSARTASAALAPVVITSSTTIRLPVPLGLAIKLPARFALRCVTLRPDWSATVLECRSAASIRVGTPIARNCATAVRARRATTSSPRLRTVAGTEGNGVNTSGRPSTSCAAAATARANIRPNAPDRCRACRSL